jgi:hypothetical protein|tara:strand:- start:942 stop:1388 length:447 start_codon:yes stop_codon:yes gene_type:complete
MKEQVLNAVRLVEGFKNYENKAIECGYVEDDEDLLHIISDFFSFEVTNWAQVSELMQMRTGEDLNQQSKDSISFIDKNVSKDNLISCACEIESIVESYGAEAAALAMSSAVQNLIVMNLSESPKSLIIADIVDEINLGDREILKHILF